MKRLILLLLLFQLCFSKVVVVNSLDGRDLVSATYYATLTGDQVVYAPPDYNAQVVYAKIGWNKEVLLIQSAEAIAMPGMASELQAKGNNVETVTSVDPYDTNRLLAQRSGAKKFLLVDPVYGYNTVSPLAYAKDNSMYLLFADADMKDDVAGALQSSGAQDILIYGYMDPEVKALLDSRGFSYREIDTGDKFDDNIEINRLYFAGNPEKKQAILSDGNALEYTIIEGNDPIVLISALVPPATYAYVKEQVSNGQISVAMVVDQEYAQTAYNLKESINNELGGEKLHVMVKFGQSVPSAGTGLFDVDLFPLPGPVLGLEVAGCNYNTNSKALEVTFRNTGNAPEYVRSSILVFVDGTYRSTIGDEEPFLVQRNSVGGMQYPIDIQSGEVTANITAYYGASKKSYEKGIQVVLPAGRVDFSDSSVLEISEFREDSATGDIFTTYVNKGDATVYFRADAAVNASGIVTRSEDENVYSVAPGEARRVKFAALGQGGADITAGAYYGAREAFMNKRVEARYSPPSQGFPLLLVGAVLLVIAVLAAAYLIFRKKK